MSKRRLWQITNEITKGDLRPGARVRGTTTGRHWTSGRLAFRSTWSGTYVGRRYDDEAGCDYHYFVEGRIGRTPQSTFGIPADTIPNN